jgi:hypothetical protein
MCALYVLERLLHVMTHARFVNLLAAALLLDAPPDARSRPHAPARAGSPDPSQRVGCLLRNAFYLSTAMPAMLIVSGWTTRF